MRERVRMTHEHREIAAERLREIRSQERVRLSATWSELPPHILDQMVDRLARRRMEQEQRADSERRRLP